MGGNLQATCNRLYLNLSRLVGYWIASEFARRWLPAGDSLRCLLGFCEPGIRGGADAVRIQARHLETFLAGTVLYELVRDADIQDRQVEIVRRKEFIHGTARAARDRKSTRL